MPKEKDINGELLAGLTSYEKPLLDIAHTEGYKVILRVLNSDLDRTLNEILNEYESEKKLRILQGRANALRTFLVKLDPVRLKKRMDSKRESLKEAELQ